MSKTIQNRISQLLQESRSFNRNDVLVHADFAKTLPFDSLVIEPFDSKEASWKIIREAQKNQKESGVNTLCVAEGYLIQGEETLQSPLLLTPLAFTIDKVRSQLKLEKVEDATFINPYVEHLLREHAILVEPNTENLASILSESGFIIDLESSPRFGNFHHHRYAILRELEELLQKKEFSIPLSSLLEDGHKSDASLSLPKDLLLPADVDHLSVFESISGNSTVIQGPPGTGKSQVLTNVLGKLLAIHKSSIVLSEKRVALEVLVQKLSEFGLGRLGFISTSDNASKDLLVQLEANWRFFEHQSFKPLLNLRLSEQYTSQLQFSLDVLNQQDAIGGVSLYEFREWMHSLEEKTHAYVGNPPAITAIQRHEELLEEIYAKGLQTSIAYIQPGTLNRYDFEVLHASFMQYKKKLYALSTKIPFSTWDEFRELIRKAYLAQSKENFERKKYTDLFRANSRKQQHFLKLYQQWIVAQTELKQLQSAGYPIRWIKKPNRVDIATLKSKQNVQGYFAKRRFYRLWKNYSNEPHNAHEQINYLSDCFAKEDVISQLIIDFCELGIINPEKEVDLLYHSIVAYTQNEWEILDGFTSEQLNYLTDSHEFLGDARRDLGKLLFLEENAPILEILNSITEHFSELVAMLPSIKQMDSETIQLLRSAPNVTTYKAIAANSHWSQFRQRFPSFSEFQMNDLHSKTKDILNAQKIESEQFATQILMEVQHRFQANHELLSIPARKLTEEEKERKKRLKKGKSILVKEFAKTRSHPTVRELFASEAREWIQLLIPLWFSNPTQISKAFPLDSGLFDVAIFDEASQIPLQNGLGALQRANHGIIAGDSEQMGPSSYFKSGQSDVMDLLHQASFHWDSIMLKHHYRSLHPDLISFSNQHFYDGSLTAYPANGITTPIQHHLIPKGIFDNRKNEMEAKAVAALIETALKKDSSIGVVAFSEEQLSCIRKQLPEGANQQLNERIDDGSAFAKSLENVQGDECDHLIISFGYAKDSEGNFAMRFGPMNTENGRRRLNVLLTRARMKLDFFSSVSYEDFKVSDNESVDLLRKWFGKLQSMDNSSSEIKLPFEAEYSIKGNELTLKKPHSHFRLAEELVTFQAVMESRGWKLKYA